MLKIILKYYTLFYAYFNRNLVFPFIKEYVVKDMGYVIK